jgi:putative oxidoreductase
MFHADHSLLQILGHVCIATFFLLIGVRNLVISGNHVNKFRKMGIPFPEALLAGGYAFQFAGGIMVLIDFYAWIGAILLIIFTVMANVLYHCWWWVDDIEHSRRQMNLFFNNVGNIGGLLLLLVLTLPG